MNIMEEVKRVVKELGEKNIRKVGSTEFEDAKKIYQALKKALEDMKSRFESSGSQDDNVFKL